MVNTRTRVDSMPVAGLSCCQHTIRDTTQHRETHIFDLDIDDLEVLPYGDQPNDCSNDTNTIVQMISGAMFANHDKMLLFGYVSRV